MPISDSNRVILIHIPKCGGSSISKELGVFGIDNNGSEKYSFEILYGNYVGRALQHLKIKEIKKIIEPWKYMKYKKMTIVRNPYDRLVSEYNWRLYCDGFKKNVTFKEFVLKYILYNEGDMSRFERLHKDHFDSQYSFLSENNRIEVNDIMKFEEIFNNTTISTHINKMDYDNKCWYNDLLREMVFNKYACDFKEFKYPE